MWTYLNNPRLPLTLVSVGWTVEININFRIIALISQRKWMKNVGNIYRESISSGSGHGKSNMQTHLYQ